MTSALASYWGVLNQLVQNINGLYSKMLTIVII